jgi:transcriptional regulator with XRE-family HTH domain
MPIESCYKEIGRRIRMAREVASLTQEQLAEGMELTRTSIVNIERGRQRIMHHDILVIAFATGVDPIWLCFGPQERRGRKRKCAKIR